MNIDKCIIEKTIKDNPSGQVKCFLKLRNNKTILIGCERGTFCAGTFANPAERVAGIGELGLRTAEL